MKKEKIFQYIYYGGIWFLFVFLVTLGFLYIFDKATTKDASQGKYKETTTILETTTEKILEVEEETTKEVEETTTEIIVTELICLGQFEVTAYCDCGICCGKSDGITATGTKATAGRTLAVDPSEIPYGSVVVIGGHEYIAEDCGGAVRGNVVDIYFDSHDEALRYGRQIHTVYIRG